MNPSPDVFEHILGIYAQLVQRRLRTARDMTPVQYAAIAAMIYRLAPCSVLVFGCGQDSLFWKEINGEGTTLFLEDLAKWSEAGRRAGLDVLDVRYESQINQWMNPVGNPGGVTEQLLVKRWDIALVDGPMGVGRGPGREQSIYMAGRLRQQHNTLVYVHDYARPWERVCCDKYLGPPTRVMDDLAIWNR